MKLSAVCVLSVSLVAMFVGCSPRRMQTTPTNPRTMAFSQAGVSLIIGEEWQCENVDSKLYPPTLVSRDGTIRVLLLPPDRSEPARVADGLRARFDANPRSAKHSFREQKFVSDHGAAGICVSYRESLDAEDPKAVVENFHYLLKNHAGRCVVINYVTSSGLADSFAGSRIIQTSLALQ